MLDASQISRRVKLRQLNVFIAVVEYGSMAKAAEHLAISQPVISKMIASLEQTLGLPLLERSRLGVEPTLYGKALLKRSIALCNDLRSSVDELQSLADPAMGELRIGSTEPVMAGLLPAIIDRLSRQYPRLALHIIEGEPPEPQDRHLRNHDIDLMICMNPETANEDVRTVHPGAAVIYEENLKLNTMRDDVHLLSPARIQEFHGAGLPVPKKASFVSGS